MSSAENDSSASDDGQTDQQFFSRLFQAKNPKFKIQAPSSTRVVGYTLAIY